MLILFFPWMNGHFATDTYHLIDMGYKKAAESSLNDGRVLMYVTGMIGNFFNLKIEIYIVYKGTQYRCHHQHHYAKCHRLMPVMHYKKQHPD